MGMFSLWLDVKLSVTTLNQNEHDLKSLFYAFRLHGTGIAIVQCRL